MNRRTLFAGILAAVFAFTAPSMSFAADPSGKTKVIIQVSDNDPAKWNLALNNAQNVQADLGKDKSEIEIVAYGPGIGMLKADSVTANRVSDAVAAGVNVVACENTMTKTKLKREDMNDKIGYVKAGVIELAQKQGQGWAYIRP